GTHTEESRQTAVAAATQPHTVSHGHFSLRGPPGLADRRAADVKIGCLERARAQTLGFPLSAAPGTASSDRTRVVCNARLCITDMRIESVAATVLHVPLPSPVRSST